MKTMYNTCEHICSIMRQNVFLTIGQNLLKSTGLEDEGVMERRSPKGVFKLRHRPISIYPGKEESEKGREKHPYRYKSSEVRELPGGWRRVPVAETGVLVGSSQRGSRDKGWGAGQI